MAGEHFRERKVLAPLSSTFKDRSVGSEIKQRTDSMGSREKHADHQQQIKSVELIFKNN